MTRETVVIGVATPTGLSAPYAYLAPAVALGYDRDEGLAFEFFYGDEPGTTARGLCAGACDIACLNTIVGFLGRANEGLPMLAIGSKARRAHRYFAVPADSPITTLEALRGKKIACDFPHIQPLAEAALAEAGVPPGGFQWAPWRGSGMEIRQMVDPVRSGAVDALFLMDWTDGDAVARGVKLRHLRAALLERIRVSSCYWTTAARFAAAGDLLARAETHPETKPDAAARDAVLRHDIEVLNACLEPMRIDDGDTDRRWCAIPAAEMAAWHEFLLRSGSIRQAVDLAQLYTTDLVERINDFDSEPVRAAARAGRA
jgi:NitT/TauT family transport system substrate-binding protein